ncbi:hypothetical protein RRF57_009371 [Xylaria bambusicola]|uniref:C2H2-type domain-containing protein n=1 Tax=Xylaria bambusicola TaxID=326684 RepID=A0AAN7UQT9_9PEZI
MLQLQDGSRPPDLVVTSGASTPVSTRIEKFSSSQTSDTVSLIDPPPLEPDASATEELENKAQELSRVVLYYFLSTRSVPSCRSQIHADGCFSIERKTILKFKCLEKQAQAKGELESYSGDLFMPERAPGVGNHLPCPFYLHKKETYPSCLTHADIREIRDLKEHLWASHRQPSYCPTCYGIFTLSEDWENHIRLRSCVSSGRPRPEGITALQMQLLAQPVDPGASRDDQWLSIWKVVFPGVKAPIPFTPGEIETAVWALRDFWAAEGDWIMSQFLTEGLQQGPHLRNHRLNVTTLGSLVIELVTEHLVARIRQD